MIVARRKKKKENSYQDELLEVNGLNVSPEKCNCYIYSAISKFLCDVLTTVSAGGRYR